MKFYSDFVLANPLKIHHKHRKTARCRFFRNL